MSSTWHRTAGVLSVVALPAGNGQGAAYRVFLGSGEGPAFAVAVPGSGEGPAVAS